jgi:hypothetical protein
LNDRRPGTVASNDRTRPQARPANVYRDRSNGIKSTGVRPSTRSAQGSLAGNRPQPTTSISGQSGTNTPSTDRSSVRPATGASSLNQNNNVFSDRDGNIYRQNSGDWQQRSEGSWKKSDRSVPSSINQSYENRNRGQQRAQSYNRAAPAMRGGGFRGR